MRFDLPHPSGVPVPQVANPLRFTEAPLPPRHAPPLLGEHTAAVLGELGLSAGDIDNLRTKGVI